jgi:hypothetical protein
MAGAIWSLSLGRAGKDLQTDMAERESSTWCIGWRCSRAVLVFYQVGANDAGLLKMQCTPCRLIWFLIQVASICTHEFLMEIAKQPGCTVRGYMKL